MIAVDTILLSDENSSLILCNPGCPLCVLLIRVTMEY